MVTAPVLVTVVGVSIMILVLVTTLTGGRLVVAVMRWRCRGLDIFGIILAGFRRVVRRREMHSQCHKKSP